MSGWRLSPIMVVLWTQQQWLLRIHLSILTTQHQSKIVSGIVFRKGSNTSFMILLLSQFLLPHSITLIMLSEQRIVTLSIIDMGQLVRPIHNNAIGTTDANAYTNRYSTPYTSSTQRLYGLNTRPMDMYPQPANDPLQTPSKYVFDFIPILDLMRLIEVIPTTQIHKGQTTTSPYRIAPNCDLFLLVRYFLSNKSFSYSR